MINRRDIIRQILTKVDGVAPLASAPLPKHIKMAANPFRFMRGSAPLFYFDLAHSAWSKLPQSLQSGIPLTMIQGDCHLANFGFITEEGSHGDEVIFSLNDFDDACIGHAAWDLLRFSTSLYLAADYLHGVNNGLYQQEKNISYADYIIPDDEVVRRAVDVFLKSYIATCDVLVTTHRGHYRVINEFPKNHVLKKLQSKAKKRAAGGKHFNHKSTLAKASVWSEAGIQFDLKNPKFKSLDKKTRSVLEKHFAPFMDDHVIDVVERIDAGTGSVNMSRYYFLIGPKVGQYPDDLSLCHIVEVKQQRCAAPLAEFADCNPGNRLNPAHLTVVCQRRMQRQPDLVLDDVQWKKVHWLVRSRHHAKVGIAPEDLLTEQSDRETGFSQYARTCGKALALAHGRADRRSTRFEQAVCNVLPQHRDTLLEISKNLAEQTQKDWKLLKEIISS